MTVPVPLACQGCGACCRHDGLPLEPDHTVPAEYVELRDGYPYLKGNPDLWICSALTLDGVCMIYDQRPAICRQTPIGGPVCLHSLSLKAKVPFDVPRAGTATEGS